MKWLWMAAGGLALGVLAVVGVGLLLPEEHEASGSLDVGAAPEEVFALITDFEGATAWREGIDSVEVFEKLGVVYFRESGSFGPMLYAVVERRQPELLTTRIADDSLPFGGTWTYELEPLPEGTRLTITERGFVRNPVFRFVSRFILGHESTLTEYLDAVQARFEAVRPS